MKVVGVHQFLSGSMKVQIASLMEKLDAWTTVILQGPLIGKSFGRVFTMVWPTLHYSIAVSTILESAVAGITKEIYKVLCPNLGQIVPTLLPLATLLWPSLVLASPTFTGSKVPQPSTSFLKSAMVTWLITTSFSVSWSGHS